jgi:hypothetical protein
MAEAVPMLQGFDREAARIGVCRNGFYPFVAFSPIPRLKSNGDRPLLRPIHSLGPTRPGGRQALLKTGKMLPKINDAKALEELGGSGAGGVRRSCGYVALGRM